MIEISINTPFITLQQALKLGNIVQSGGIVKFFLKDENILVNGVRTTERGKKLYPGDELFIKDQKIVITTKTNEN